MDACSASLDRRRSGMAVCRACFTLWNLDSVERRWGSQIRDSSREDILFISSSFRENVSGILQTDYREKISVVFLTVCKQSGDGRLLLWVEEDGAPRRRFLSILGQPGGRRAPLMGESLPGRVARRRWRVLIEAEFTRRGQAGSVLLRRGTRHVAAIVVAFRKGNKTLTCQIITKIAASLDRHIQMVSEEG